ncbi:MAG: hypothetical protein V4498_10315 [candidate division FCPU426 bacterium]
MGLKFKIFFFTFLHVFALSATSCLFAESPKGEANFSSSRSTTEVARVQFVESKIASLRRTEEIFVSGGIFHFTDGAVLDDEGNLWEKFKRLPEKETRPFASVSSDGSCNEIHLIQLGNSDLVAGQTFDPEGGDPCHLFIGNKKTSSYFKVDRGEYAFDSEFKYMFISGWEKIFFWDLEGQKRLWVMSYEELNISPLCRVVRAVILPKDDAIILTLDCNPNSDESGTDVRVIDLKGEIKLRAYGIEIATATGDGTMLFARTGGSAWTVLLQKISLKDFSYIWQKEFEVTTSDLELLKFGGGTKILDLGSQHDHVYIVVGQSNYVSKTKHASISKKQIAPKLDETFRDCIFVFTPKGDPIYKTKIFGISIPHMISLNTSLVLISKNNKAIRARSGSHWDTYELR